MRRPRCPRDVGGGDVLPSIPLLLDQKSKICTQSSKGRFETYEAMFGLINWPVPSRIAVSPLLFLLPSVAARVRPLHADTGTPRGGHAGDAGSSAARHRSGTGFRGDDP